MERNTVPTRAQSADRARRLLGRGLEQPCSCHGADGDPKGSKEPERTYPGAVH